MYIPLKALKYTVAIGNLIHLILWTVLETWILAGLFISLTYSTQSNQWVYVECSPVVFYIMLIKFFGAYGAYYQNHIFIVIHIMLSTVYILAISLSIIHLTLFGEDSVSKPTVWQQILSVVYHLSNFILLILSVLLFFVLRAIRSTLSSAANKTEESGSASESAANKEEDAKVSDNKLFKRLVPKEGVNDSSKN